MENEMPYDAARDNYGPTYGPTVDGQARKVAAVTPHDSNDLAVYAKALYIGGAGDIRVIPVENADGAPVTFTAHQAGYVPIQVRRVLATGTTATGILALI